MRRIFQATVIGLILGGCEGRHSDKSGSLEEPPSDVVRIVTVDVDDPHSGASVSIPNGAIDVATVVTLYGIEHFPVEMSQGQEMLKAISLEVEDEASGAEITEFSDYLTITIPFKNFGTHIPIVFYIDENGEPDFVPLSDINGNEGTFSFETNHASVWTWLEIPFISAPHKMVYTTFEPALDGFKVGNNGSAINKNGECHGMASWAMWYFSKGRDFYNEFDELIQSVPAQEIIATRAHLSVTQSYQSRYAEAWRKKLALASDMWNYAIIAAILESTGKPVQIGLIGPNAEHMVLAYAVEGEKVFIYDPNLPGVASYLEFDVADGHFKSYRAYDKFFPYATGGIGTREQFDSILKAANEGFSGSSSPLVQLTSHTREQQVSEEVVLLQGKVSSGEVRVEELHANVNDRKYKLDLDQDSGRFIGQVRLREGPNKIGFFPKGLDAKLKPIALTPGVSNDDTYLIAGEVTLNRRSGCIERHSADAISYSCDLRDSPGGTLVSTRETGAETIYHLEYTETYIKQVEKLQITYIYVDAVHRTFQHHERLASYRKINGFWRLHRKDVHLVDSSMAIQRGAGLTPTLSGGTSIQVYDGSFLERLATGRSPRTVRAVAYSLRGDGMCIQTVSCERCTDAGSSAAPLANCVPTASDLERLNSVSLGSSHIYSKYLSVQEEKGTDLFSN